MSSVGKSVGKNAQKIAQKAAQQMLNEPMEVLKTAGEQVAGPRENPISPERQQEQAIDIQQKEARDRARSKSLLEANENELEEIRIRNAQSKQQKEIQEKKEEQQKEIENQKKGGISEPTTKRKRGAIGQFIDKVKTRVERRQPPSG